MNLDRLDNASQIYIKTLREKENRLILTGVPRFMVFRNYCKVILIYNEDMIKIYS
jgi:hypothetical protein